MFVSPHTIRKFLSKQDRNAFNAVKVFLFDCDGVLWKGDQPISGAVDTVNYLKEIGKTIYYVTNNSTKSRADTLRKIQSFGINSTIDEVLTSSYATAQYLKKQSSCGDVYVVGEKGIYDELQAMSIPCSGMEDNDQHDIHCLSSMNPNVHTVVVGLDRNVNYVKISRAASYIRDYQCQFVATNTDATFPNAGGVISGGSGCIVSAISTVCGKKPDYVIGKPSSCFIDLIKDQNPGLLLNEIMMVGDRLDTDILFANQNKIHSLCVLSGISNEKDIQTSDDNFAPEYYTSGLKDVKELFM